MPSVQSVSQQTAGLLWLVKWSLGHKTPLAYQTHEIQSLKGRTISPMKQRQPPTPTVVTDEAKRKTKSEKKYKISAKKKKIESSYLMFVFK